MTLRVERHTGGTDEVCRASSRLRPQPLTDTLEHGVAKVACSVNAQRGLVGRCAFGQKLGELIKARHAATFMLNRLGMVMASPLFA